MFPSSFLKIVVFSSMLVVTGACTHISDTEHLERVSKLPKAPSFGVPTLSNDERSVCAESEEVEISVPVLRGDAELISSVSLRWNETSDWQEAVFELSQGDRGTMLSMHAQVPEMSREECAENCVFSLQVQVTLSDGTNVVLAKASDYILRSATNGPEVVESAFVNYLTAPFSWDVVYAEAASSTSNYFAVSVSDYPAMRVALGELELGYGVELPQISANLAMCPEALGNYDEEQCQLVLGSAQSPVLGKAEAEFEFSTEDFSVESCRAGRYDTLWQWYILVSGDLCAGDVTYRLSDYAFRVVRHDCDGDSHDEDCDDDDPTINAGANDIPDDGIDQDCNGSDTVTCFADEDHDGFGDPNSILESPSGGCSGTRLSADGTDCNDQDQFSYPGARETPSDGRDSDCNGYDGMECSLDADNDGYGDRLIRILSEDDDCSDAGESDLDTDCDDTDPGSNPGEADVADDGVDQDCSGFDTVTCSVDSDGDGFGSTVNFVLSADGDCSDPGESWDSTDCDDSEELVNPASVEVCDGVDNDCDAQTKERKSVTLRGMGYSSISDALANAVNGDVIELCSGTFSENITVDQTISLVGVLGPNKTEIQTSNGSPTITVVADDVAISGVAITGTNDEGGIDYLQGGGGIQAPDAVGLSLTDVWLVDSTSGACAGGLFGADTSIVDSEIQGNGSTTVGGGFCAVGDVSVVRTEVYGNAAVVSGGGAYLASGLTTFEASTLQSNSAVDGGGVFVSISASLDSVDTEWGDGNDENAGGDVYTEANGTGYDWDGDITESCSGGCSSN